MKVIIEIPDKVYKNAKDGMLDELQSMLICGSVTEGKPLLKDATNGDMVKAMFPEKCPHIGFNENFGRVWIMENGEDIANFRLDWWNAPYKGSEG